MEFEDDERRKLSFSYDVCGEKLRLIDVSKEDDFLIDSPLFHSLEDLRLSAFDGTNEDEAFKMFRLPKGNTAEETKMQKEQNFVPSCSMEPARPSYLRKSLAWDSAFFNSAGVLDSDELAFLNRGLKAVEDIPVRRSETNSSFHGLRKTDTCQRSKTGFQEHSTQRSEKTKIKHNSQSAESSWKRSKAASKRMTASLNEYNNAETKNAAKLGKHMMHSKKSAFRNSCSHENAISLSGSSRKVPSTIVRGKTESQKGKLCASSLPFGTPAKSLKSNKEFGYPKTPRSKQKQQADSSSSLSLQREEMNEETVERTSHVSTEPRKKFKPSGLRQPSPKLGFFDEFQPKVYGKIDLQDNNTLLGKSQHTLQSAPGIKGRTNPLSDKRIWNSSPKVSSTMKSWSEVASRRHGHKSVGMKEEGTCCNKSRKNEAREGDRKQVKKMVKKNASSHNFQEDEDRKTRTLFNWEDQVSDLSKYFDIIDLNKDVLMEFKDKNKNKNMKNILDDDQQQGLANIFPPNSSGNSRTPLADRTSLCCNQNGTFKSPAEINQGKLAKQKTSLFFF